MTNVKSEQRLRRVLRRDGYRLWKVREDSRDYYEYGPYSVVAGDQNVIVARGLDLGEVERWITA